MYDVIHLMYDVVTRHSDQMYDVVIRFTWATLQARIAAGTPAPAVAVPAATPPALIILSFQISSKIYLY